MSSTPPSLAIGSSSSGSIGQRAAPKSASSAFHSQSQSTSRIATSRLVTSRPVSARMDRATSDNGDDLKTGSRTGRVRKSATAAGTNFVLKNILLAGINSANTLLNEDPKAEEKVPKAIQAAAANVHHSQRENFAKPDIQLGHLVVAANYQIQIVRTIIEQIPKVQSTLLNVGTVVGMGGGPCSDALAFMDYFIKHEKERQVGFSRLTFRVIDAEPQWKHTWEPAFEAINFQYIEFEERDYDNITTDGVKELGLDKADVISFSFVNKPVFRAMWDETNKLMETVVETSKEGAFFLWVNHADARVNRYFEKWMDKSNMLLQYQFDGKVSALQPEALKAANFQEVASTFGFVEDFPDSNLFARVYRKAKANVMLPHITRSVASKKDSDSDSSSDSDSDSETKPKPE